MNRWGLCRLKRAALNLAALLPAARRRHGDALGALSATLTAKWLNTEGRQKLRLVWDRTR